MYFCTKLNVLKRQIVLQDTEIALLTWPFLVFVSLNPLGIMSLKTQIDAQIKQAMLDKNQTRLLALRAIKSAILLEETSGANANGLSADAEMKILTKAVKQRRDSADIYRQQDRPDLLEKELVEIAVIEEFLPKQLSEDEIKAALQAIIAKVGAAAPSDMGKVMGVASKELAGKADGRVISALVKQLLG